MSKSKHEGIPYFYIDIFGNIVKERDTDREMDEKLYNAENYFKTREDLLKSDLYNAYYRGLKERDDSYRMSSVAKKKSNCGDAEIYYYIASDGSIQQGKSDEGEIVCKRRRGKNYFRTEIEAKQSILYKMFFEEE